MTKEQAAAYAKEKLWAFPKIASSLQAPRHIRFIADKIQEKLALKTEKFKLLMVSCPPRHGKTVLISKHLPAWYLGHNPDKRIILTSYSSDLSDQNSDYAKDVFAKWGPVFWNSYPSPNLYNRSAWNTTMGGGVISAGITGSITGFGADLFLVDDYFKNDEEAESQAQREKLWSKWQSVISSRLHPGSLVIILATRWNDDGLIGRLLEQAKTQGDKFPFDWEYINLPALAEENDPLGREEGEALWPERYSKERLEHIKNIVGPYWWAALYQGSPTSRGGNLFKSEFFRYYDRDKRSGDYLCYKDIGENPIRVFKNEIRISTFVDPALEESERNDPFGMVAYGYSRKKRLWLLFDRFNDRIDHTKALSVVLNFAYKNRSKDIYIENEKIGKILIKQSEGKDDIGGRKIPFKELPTKGQDKYARATPMASYYENGRVFHSRDMPNVVQFEENLKKFPGGAHDEDGDLAGMAASMEMRRNLMDVLSEGN